MSKEESRAGESEGGRCLSPETNSSEERQNLDEEQSKTEKRLSFSPRVETYDIPRPAVVLTRDDDDDEPCENNLYDSTPPNKDCLTTNARAQRQVRRQSTMLGSRNRPNSAVSGNAPQNTPRNSPSPSGKGPDWYEELTESQVSMFKEVFELLDHDGGGTINAEELYDSLKDLDIGIRREEIDNVLQELDKDGNGEIDFDEFLYAMSMTDRYIDQMTGVADQEEMIAYSRRQRLFFTAITRFAIKNSLNDIERYYANKARQAPHVISFYTAGARLIGLNDRQLEQELKRLQKASKNQDSPYAKLPFMTTRPKKAKRRKRSSKGKGDGVSTEASTAGTKDDTDTSIPADEPNIPMEESDAALRAYQSSRRSRRSNIMPDSTDFGEIEKLLSELANEGSIVARLPGIHLVPAIRTKLDNGDKGMLCSSLRKKKKCKMMDGTVTRAKSARSGRDGASPKTSKRNRLAVPKMTSRRFDMPTIPMSEKKLKSLTIEDVPYIRQTVSKALGKYYGTMQKNHVKNAWDHWDHLHVDLIQSSKFKENFRQVYGAYSPHKEDDVFVIAPWIPGPRYTSACAPKPASSGYMPSPRPHSQPSLGYHSRGIVSRGSSRGSSRPITGMA